MAPYCKDWEPKDPPNTSDCLRFPWIPLRYTQTPSLTFPRHPPDIYRHHKMPTDDKRPRQTYWNSTCQCPGVSGAVCLCLLLSVVVCLHLLLPGDVWWVSGGCLVGVWRYLSGIHGNRRHSGVFGGYLGSQSLQYGATTLFWHSPERHNFCHLTLLRHWNNKMVTYKLSKNGWVMLFFVNFRLAKEKLLVTVALDHPVLGLGDK